MLKHSTILEKDKIEAIAIGGFDGIHKGHQELLRRVGKNAAAVIIDKDYANITPSFYRCRYIKCECFIYDFNEIKHLSGDEFIDLLKREFKNLKKIVVGYDFRFGAKKCCGINELKKSFPGAVEVVDEVKVDGISVHSDTIRSMIKNGDIKKVNTLLGREFSIVANVISGQGLGKKSLYPTINVVCKNFIIPKSGVYATRTLINTKKLPSVTFIGKRESTDGKFSIETHIIKTREAIEVKSGNEVEIFFVDFIRENRKFDTLQELKKQIGKDIENAIRIDTNKL